MKNNIRVLIVDGVGINLKTSIMDELAKRGEIVVRSDSSYYQIANPTLFPHLDDITNKLQCRFMEILVAKDLAVQLNKEVVFVDRGLFNQIVWAYLLDTETVDDYLQNKEGYKHVLGHMDEYIKLEDSLNSYRLVLETRREDILRDSLDESLYEKDPHATFRIDTFYDVEYYQIVQQKYLDFYWKSMPSGHVVGMAIDNKRSLENTISYLADFAQKLAYSPSWIND